MNSPEQQRRDAAAEAYRKSAQTSHLDVAYAESITAAITVTREQLSEAAAAFDRDWHFTVTAERDSISGRRVFRTGDGLTAALTAIGFRVATGPIMLTPEQAKIAEDASGDRWPEVRTKLAELGFEVES